MNDIEIFFEEYEKWLQSDIENSDRLDESMSERFDEFSTIVNDMLKAYQEVKREIYSDTNTEYVDLECVDTKGFLYKPEVYIIFKKPNATKAMFIPNACRYDSITDTMSNAEFIYYENEDTLNIYVFKKSMYHELQHAYRHYQILKQEDINKNLNGKIAHEKQLYADFIDNERINNICMEIYYYTNINEIDGHMSSMYAFLEKTPQINTRNYKKYLKFIPGYKFIERLKDIQNIFNNNYIEMYPGIKKQIGNTFYEIYSHNPIDKYNNLTPQKCFKLTKRKVNQSLLYAEKIFYRNIKESLKALKR